MKIKPVEINLYTYRDVGFFGDGAILIGCGIMVMVMEMYGDMDTITIGLDLSLLWGIL